MQKSDSATNKDTTQQTVIYGSQRESILFIYCCSFIVISVHIQALNLVKCYFLCNFM
jgi:hypothetical protein